MKKIFYSLMTVAALLTAASCQKEFTNSADPAFGGKPVVTTFNVDLGVATKAVESSTLDDGTTANKLYVAVFGSDGALISTSLVGNNAVAINKSTTVKLTLSKGQAYDIVFFAMYDGAYDVTFSNGPTATFAYKSGAKANDPKLDAFYKKISIASASTTTESVTLKRPFAQINVLSSNAPDAQSISSSMTVKGVPTTFDLFNEAAGTTTTDLAFAENSISAAAFGKYANAYTWLAMNFVLPNSEGLVELSFQATGMEKALSVKNVAVKKNGRTNLIGAIYDLDAELTYTVTIDEVFDSEGEGDLNDTETVIATTTTYNANNPLVIDASNSLNPVSVTLTVNGGDSFNTIETGASGAVIEASSDNEEVATAEVDKTGNAVKITPVANGTANITVTTPRYTKGYTAGSITIPVRVEGIAAPAAEDPTLTVDGAPTTAMVTEPFTLTVDTNSDGEVTVTVDPSTAATVAAGTVAGTYVVTPATDLAEDTDATVTVAVAATDAFNAASEVIQFTVPGNSGGTQDEGLSVTEIIALADNAEFTAKESLVVAKQKRGVIVTDGTNNVLVYNWADGASTTADLAIGDKITFKGTKKTYNGVPEVDPVTDIVVASSGNTVTYPTANDITSTIDSYAGTTAEFISFTGTISVSGNYTNIVVAGATRQGSVTFPTGDPELVNGQNAVLKGYFNGLSGSGGKYVNIIVVSVESAGAVESSISVNDMSVEVGKTKTIQATVTPSTAAVTYTTTSNKIEINGNVIKGVSEGTATVTATIAAVEGSYTGSSTTFTVTVTPASGGDESTATLTNDEIVAALSASSATSNSYADFSISSASGTWSGNMNTKNDLTFVQIRNNKGAHLTSPTFSKNIEKIELTVNGGGGTNVQSRKFYAVAANTSFSGFVADKNYNANENKDSWAAVTKYGDAESTASDTNVEQTVTITLDSSVDTKDFMLVTYNGAAYITSITVYFK